MNARNQFIQTEAARLLEPGENILNVAAVFQGPLYWSSLLGGVLGQLLMLTHYFAVLTDKRLVLMETGMGMLGLKCENRRVKEFRVADLASVESGGFMNQRTLTLARKDGTSETIRFNSMVKAVEGQKQFGADVLPRLQQMIQAEGKR